MAGMAATGSHPSPVAARPAWLRNSAVKSACGSTDLRLQPLQQFGRLHRVTGCNRFRLAKQVHGCRKRAAHSGGLQQELPTGQGFLG